MDISNLQFLLKLFECPNYRALLSGPRSSFKAFKGKDKIVDYLGERGLIDFTREIAGVILQPAGKALLGLDPQDFPISETELKILDKIHKSPGIAPSQIIFKLKGKNLTEKERTKILESFGDRGFISFTTKRQKNNYEVWLTEQGLKCIEQVNQFFSSWDISAETVKPTDEEVLQAIIELDKELRTDNYLPIFHLRERFKTSLRSDLDEVIYRLQETDRIEMSSLAEPASYSLEEIKAGIEQIVGGPLFFISYQK